MVDKAVGKKKKKNQEVQTPAEQCFDEEYGRQGCVNHNASECLRFLAMDKYGLVLPLELRSRLPPFILCNIYIHICMYLCMYIRMCVCVCVCVYVYVCIHIYMSMGKYGLVLPRIKE